MAPALEFRIKKGAFLCYLRLEVELKKDEPSACVTEREEKV